MTATPTVVAAALAQVEQGFAVFALGKNVKTPITTHGFQDASRDPEKVRAQLALPACGNYGMTWPPDAPTIVVTFDLDDGSDGLGDWETAVAKLKSRLGDLPVTKATRTPSGGYHLFYYWTGVIPPGDELYGFTVRWPGRGYLVGPGSSIDGKVYEEL